MRAAFRITHKYLGLTVSLLWLLQAISGIVLVFHRPLDDSLLGATGQAADLHIIDRAIRAIEQQTPGANVVQYFPSGGISGQIDLLVNYDNAPRKVIRINGATGAILRSSAWATPVSELNAFRLLLLFHKQLLAGNAGHWFIGISGILLFTNILLALKLAWPKQGWRRALLPRRRHIPAAAMFAWHRATGLWLAPLGLLMALTGALLAWQPSLEQITGAAVTPPAAGPLRVQHEYMIPAAKAVKTAFQVYPDAGLAAVTLPDNTSRWYAVMLRQPGELRETYGTTAVYVDAYDGTVLKNHNALTAGPMQKLLMALWPIHTGEWGGTDTRLVTLATGTWLITTLLFGYQLWLLRRRARDATHMINPADHHA